MEFILIALVAALALQHLIYAIQNLVNLEQAHESVRTVFGQDDALFYPRSLMPKVRGPALTRVGLGIIIGFEFVAGVLLAIGAIAMGAASGSPEAVEAAAQWARLGCGVALLLWFGLFLTIGAALFQMWQTQLGQGAMGDAFRSGMFAAVVLLLLG